jgi:hypothetical protein
MAATILAPIGRAPFHNTHGTQIIIIFSPQDASMVAKTALASLPTFHNAPFDLQCGL